MFGRLAWGIAFAALLVQVAPAGPAPVAANRPGAFPRAVRPFAVVATPSEVSTPPIAVPLPRRDAQPVRLLIPSVHVDAQVEALGVDSSGAMDTPRDVRNVGWYREGPAPGAPGDAVIDGHVGLPGAPLVFSGLARAAIGAEVVTVLADGTRSRFAVSSLKSWPANARPPGLFSGDGQPRLSLITCIGVFDRASQRYADRLIVEARYVGPA